MYLRLPPNIAYLIVSPPVIGVGMWLWNRDLLRHGRAKLLGVTGLLAAWLMPFLVLGYSQPLFPPPKRFIQWLGYALMSVGLGGGLLAATRFRSAERIVGMKSNRLFVGGPYRFSRNPQYVLTALFPTGYALTWRSPMSWVAVGLFAIVVHLTVLVEERHLTRVFGDKYLEYKNSTPRYLGR